MDTLKQSQTKKTKANIQKEVESSNNTHLQPVEELHDMVGNQALGRLIESQSLPNQPTNSSPNLLLKQISTVNNSPIQRQPLFRGLSHELIGNREGSLVQAKLTINQPGDKYEQEADRVAAQVVKQINAPISQRSDQAEAIQGQKLMRKSVSSPSPVAGGMTTTPNLETAIKQEQSYGQPIEATSDLETEKQDLQTATQSTKNFGHNNEQGTIKQISGLIQRQEALAGEAVIPDLESSIQQAQGGGHPLVDRIRQPMEQAFGADFNEVKIHTDAQSDAMNRSIQAKAFTIGQDIFFRQGEYQPNNKSGQELIAHELTHTIQQGGSKIHRKINQSLITSAHQTLQSKPLVLQMKSVIVNNKAHAHIIDGKENKKVGSALNLGDIVEISDNAQDHIKNKKGTEVEWYRLTYTPSGRIYTAQNQYIRATKIFADIDVGAESGNQEIDNALFGAFNENAINTSSESLDKFSKQIEKQKGNTSKVDIAGGTMTAVSGILGMALSIKNLVKSNRSFTDWISTIWDSIVNSGKLVSGVTKIISSSVAKTSKTATKSKGVSDWSGSFASAFETLAGGVKTFKSIIALIRMVFSDDKYSKDEYLKSASDILAGALKTAKGVVETIKSFIEISSEVGKGLLQAIPGLDIAISATKIITQGYYLAKSAYSSHKVRGESRKLEEDLEIKGQDKDKVSASKKQYQSKRAEITNSETRKAAKEAKNTTRREQIQQLEAEDKKLEEEQNNLLKQKNGAPDDKERKAIDEEINNLQSKRDDIQDNIDVLRGQLNKTEQKINAADREIQKRQTEMDDYAKKQGISQDEIAELELADELKAGNRKRIIRQSIHIGGELTKIGGSIATLTGVGAAAGVATKAAAAGIEISLPFFRSLKEYGRKKAAQSQAKGETGTLSQSIFNANKSDQAKLESRKRHTITIFKMVNHLNEFLPDSTDTPEKMAEKRLQLPKHCSRVENFIKATGCELRELYSLNGKSDEQAALILQSLYKREF